MMDVDLLQSLGIVFLGVAGVANTLMLMKYRKVLLRHKELLRIVLTYTETHQ